MTYANYREMIKKSKEIGLLTVSVAAACDTEVLKTIGSANGLAKFILVGDREKLLKMAVEFNVNLSSCEIIDESDPIKAASEAINQINQGNADCLMKGFLNTSDLMRLVLNKEKGLRTGNMLSHIAALEIPGFDRIIFVTDAGLNIAPNLDEKKQILENAINFLTNIGYRDVNAAVLAANEAVSSKQPVTIDASAIKEMAEKGEIQGAVVDGPLSFDLAISQEAAEHKKSESVVAGKADLLLVPSIEAGNLMCKGIMYCANAVMAGLVVGARVPIIVVSRASTMDEKIASIAMAGLTRIGRYKKNISAVS